MAAEISAGDGLADLLTTLAELIRCFVALLEVEARVIALWVVHTHAFDAAEATPYLSITSAEKRCGRLNCSKCSIYSLRTLGRRLGALRLCYHER